MRIYYSLFVVILLAVGLMAFGRCNGCGSGYSDGERAGQIVKFSNKGLIAKSWEGELNLGGFKTNHTDKGDQVVANVFEFTVRDQTLVPKISAALATGERVTLVYRQWFMPPWTMDTSYEIVAIRSVPNGQ